MINTQTRFLPAAIFSLHMGVFKSKEYLQTKISVCKMTVLQGSTCRLFKLSLF